jgi:DNA-binding NtrC family response regulator
MEKILIVDDNKYIRFALTSLLEDAGFKPIAVGDGYKAIKEVKTKNPSLVILDMKLPGMDGIQILEELKKIDPNIIVIMLTAFGDVKTAVQSIKVGAYDYLTKPFDNEEMVLMIKKALETKYLNQEVQQLWRKMDEQYLSRDIIGSSPAMQEILNQVKIVAPTNMTVVIQGESGTGKEVIANLIHKKSLRGEKNLVAIDCGAIPETLIESELFGYEKGAFTGADAQKEGKFEQANEGTLFLDEITNLSEGNQLKLLRVIQEKKVSRLGGKKDHNVDVRILAATNIRLAEAVKEGRFRSDLYYRLNEFHMNLPTLKDRKEDIPLFVKYFTQDANSELNKIVKSFSTKAMKTIMNYGWPGNVRELRNVIRRAVLMSQSDVVDYVPLPEENLNLNDEINAGDILKEKSSLDNYTKQFERDLIMKALQEAGGNKTKAAKILNMNERTFYRKIKNLGL